MAYLRDILPDLKMQLDFSVPAVKNVPEVCPNMALVSTFKQNK